MANDLLQVQPEDEHAPVTREWVKLTLQAMRADIRLLVGLSIVGNQFLSHISLPSLVGYLGGGALFVAGVAKAFFLR